jgi:hypothetical protein
VCCVVSPCPWSDAQPDPDPATPSPRHHTHTPHSHRPLPVRSFRSFLPLFGRRSYWAEALANQSESPELAAEFKSVFAELAANEATILAELASASGQPADIGGYYHPDHKKAEAVMRPSATLNAIVDARLSADLGA